MMFEVKLKKVGTKNEYIKTIDILEAIKINGSYLRKEEIKKEKNFLAMSMLDGYADGKVRYAGNGDKIISVKVI